MRHTAYVVKCKNTNHGLLKFRRSGRWLRDSNRCPACGKAVNDKHGLATKGHEKYAWNGSKSYQRFYGVPSVYGG